MPDDLIAVLARADELYRRRSEPGAVGQSLEILTSMPSGRYETQWRLARSLFFLGQQAASLPAKQQLHAAAIGAGESAASLNPNRVEGRFWLGVNLALFAEAAGGWRGVRAILHARRELKQAAKIDAGYHAAGPLRVLGRLDHRAPWFLGGSSRRIMMNFDRALELAPYNSVTLLYAAEQALDAGDEDRAALLLGRIIESLDDPEWEFENRRDREVARSMLERLRSSH